VTRATWRHPGTLLLVGATWVAVLGGGIYALAVACR